MSETGEPQDPNLIRFLELEGGDGRIIFEPPIRVETSDFDDEGCITMGRIAYRAVLRPDAPPQISALSQEGRREYAGLLERHFNFELGKNTPTHNYGDGREHAAAIYGAFLAVGVLATVEVVNNFVPLPPSELQ